MKDILLYFGVCMLLCKGVSKEEKVCGFVLCMDKTMLSVVVFSNHTVSFEQAKRKGRAGYESFGQNKHWTSNYKPSP